MLKMSHVPSAPIKLGEIPPAKETETWLIRAPPNNRKEITIPILQHSVMQLCTRERENKQNTITMVA